MALQNIFTTVCNMTLTASIVIGCVLLARLALKKAPRVFSYALWLVVLFRLLCPVSLPSPVSVLNAVEAPRSELGTIEYLEPPVQTPLETVIPIDGGLTAAPSAPVSVEAPPDWNLIGTWVWLVVACGLLGYGFLSYVNLKRKLRESVPAEAGVREIDAGTTPFVLGFFRPVIYLPSGLDGREREYVLLHERLHVRHFDPQVRAVFFIAVCLHWFNPLVWVAFFLFCRDMEMRCDEAVLKALGGEIRCDYAQSLLNFATGRFALAAPLAFGEGDTGRRVRNVLNWKKKGRWMLILAAMVCTGVFVMTGCDPAREPESPFGHSYSATAADGTVEEVTLTSDQILFFRNSALAVDMEDAFHEIKELPDTCDACTDEQWAALKQQTAKAWTGSNGCLLLRLKDGSLHLTRQGVRYELKRVDLLNVIIQTVRGEDHLLPVWCPGGDPEERRSDLIVTLAEDTATLRFEPAMDVDSMMVSEEYFQRMENGEFSVLVTDTVLDRERGFNLEVRRRGDAGDDHAIYTVQMEGQVWMFRLAFPAVPGETSYSAEPEETTNLVEYNEGANIRLRLPQSWEYSFDNPEGEDAYSYGISFWPRGYEGTALRLHFYPQGFGVCGTGLETEEMELAGRTVSVGTYDDHTVWDYIALGDDFAVWGEGHGVWWEEYGDTAMEILNSVELGPQID